MDMKELLNKIKFNDKGEIDEALVSEISEAVKAEIDSKVNEKAQVIAEDISNTLVDKYKEELNEKYESKFDEYKNMITEKFSDFLDTVLDEELNIPADVVEFARKGKLYSDLIEQFKIRLGIDEGALSEEAKDLIKEARDEIVSLRESINKLEKEKMDLTEDNKKIASDLYARIKCDGLTESQKTRALKLLEGCDSKEEIDSKFEVINETLFTESNQEPLNEDENKEEKQPEEKHCICPKCGRETTITEGACNLYNCPDCEDTPLTDKSECDNKETDKKVEENKEDKTGFDALLEQYKKNFESKSW